MKERADKLLVERALAPRREKAQAFIMAGLVTAGGRRVAKPGELLDPATPLEVARPLPFVGRGGLKLEEALEHFGVDVRGLAAVDIGASTGGFVDCLLKRGAARVYAVDVDTKQLDWGLSRDARVVAVERNARALAPEDIPEAPGLITMDVSFISVLKILPALRAIPGEWSLVSLIKPQFEADPKDGRGGPRRCPDAGRRGGPRARLRPGRAHPLRDAGPEGERRVLRLVDQGQPRAQQGRGPSLDQGGGEP